MSQLLALTAAAAAVPTAPACPAADAVPTRATLDDAAEATQCVLNQERRALGVPALRSSTCLHRAAQRYSHDMAERNFFSHDSPGGSSLLERVRSTSYLKGAGDWRLGETLAWGAEDRATPAAIVRAWMNSPEHLEVIRMASFRHVGIGVAIGAPVKLGWVARAATFTADFGTRGG